MGRRVGDDQPVSAAGVAWLTSPLAVAERCGNVFEAGRAGDLEHFRVVEERLGEAARYVAGVITARPPAAVNNLDGVVLWVGHDLRELE